MPVFLFAYANRFGAKIRPLQLSQLAVSSTGCARWLPPRGRFGFNEPHTAKTKRQALPVLLFWRRRRDLNPRASCPTYTLSRGASSPLEYFSKVKMFFEIFSFWGGYFFLRPTRVGGESGIRTHVGLHPNGFQDRLVMTASISLRIR